MDLNDMLRTKTKANKTAQKKVLLAIFENTWSQLDPDHRASIVEHKELVDTVMDELLPGTRELRVFRTNDVEPANDES